MVCIVVAGIYFGWYAKKYKKWPFKEEVVPPVVVHPVVVPPTEEPIVGSACEPLSGRVNTFTMYTINDSKECAPSSCSDSSYSLLDGVCVLPSAAEPAADTRTCDTIKGVSIQNGTYGDPPGCAITCNSGYDLAPWNNTCILRMTDEEVAQSQRDALAAERAREELGRIAGDELEARARDQLGLRNRPKSLWNRFGLGS